MAPDIRGVEGVCVGLVRVLKTQKAECRLSRGAMEQAALVQRVRPCTRSPDSHKDKQGAKPNPIPVEWHQNDNRRGAARRHTPGARPGGAPRSRAAPAGTPPRPPHVRYPPRVRDATRRPPAGRQWSPADGRQCHWANDSAEDCRGLCAPPFDGALTANSRPHRRFALRAADHRRLDPSNVLVPRPAAAADGEAETVGQHGGFGGAS